MKLAIAVLALLALGQLAHAQSRSKCQTILQVIEKTRSLSMLKTIAAQKIPALDKITSDNTGKYTFLAPSDKALKLLAAKALQLGLFDPTKAVNLLLSHVLRGNYDSQKAWVKANGKKIQRLALGPVTVSIQIADDFRRGIATYIIVLSPVTPGYKSVRISFASNKKSPAIKTCAGTVYIVDELFIADV